jgi:hypothetical protein
MVAANTAACRDFRRLPDGQRIRSRKVVAAPGNEFHLVRAVKAGYITQR